MKDTSRVAGTYIAAIIGAGYASGQEVIQFFTSYGWLGIVGTFVSMGLYPLLGYFLVVLGDKLQVSSHKGVIYHLCGKYLGLVIDILLVFFLFGVGVIMVSGSVSLFRQHFGIISVVVYFVFMSLVILSIILSLRKIVTILSWMSPYAFILIILLAVYSLFISHTNISELETISKTQLSASPNWLLS